MLCFYHNGNYTPGLLESSQQLYEVDSVIIPILEVEKLKLREDNRLAQGHTAANPDLEFIFLFLVQCLTNSCEES